MPPRLSFSPGTARGSCSRVARKKSSARRRAPGAVDTRMMREAAPFLRTRTTPADVARSIRFLCDDEESGALTGTVIEIQSNE